MLGDEMKKWTLVDEISDSVKCKLKYYNLGIFIDNIRSLETGRKQSIL